MSEQTSERNDYECNFFPPPPPPPPRACGRARFKEERLQASNIERGGKKSRLPFLIISAAAAATANIVFGPLLLAVVEEVKPASC